MITVLYNNNNKDNSIFSKEKSGYSFNAYWYDLVNKEDWSDVSYFGGCSSFVYTNDIHIVHKSIQLLNTAKELRTPYIDLNTVNDLIQHGYNVTVKSKINENS